MSDDDSSDLFDTDNVVVCQFDRVCVSNIHPQAIILHHCGSATRKPAALILSEIWIGPLPVCLIVNYSKLDKLFSWFYYLRKTGWPNYEREVSWIFLGDEVYLKVNEIYNLLFFLPQITRSKNKWKFHLKDGIMNLNTKDYVFTKATGEAEW